MTIAMPTFYYFIALSSFHFCPFKSFCFLYRLLRSCNLRKIKASANKNRAILEPQAIFNEIPASGFSFCSLLFLDIKKPQPLDFSKDCGAYFTYLALITRLLNDCSNPTRTYCTSTLTVFE